MKKGGDAAISACIKGQLDNRSCAVILAGKDTADRK
ncbi:TIR domain-containing protein, partial [Serratia marcescens]